MIKIIDGLRYNTETAKEVAWDNNSLAANDFNYISEKLFLTKKGSWFIYGLGGANTIYAKHYGSSRSGGETIIPISREAALEWLTAKDFIAETEEYFKGEIQDA